MSVNENTSKEMNYTLVLTVQDDNEQHLDNLRVKLTGVLSKYPEMDKVIVMCKTYILDSEWMNFYNHILDYIESELEKSEKMYELFKLNRTTEINMLPYDEIDLTDMSIDAEFTGFFIQIATYKKLLKDIKEGNIPC